MLITGKELDGEVFIGSADATAEDDGFGTGEMGVGEVAGMAGAGEPAGHPKGAGLGGGGAVPIVSQVFPGKGEFRAGFCQGCVEGAAVRAAVGEGAGLGQLLGPQECGLPQGKVAGKRGEAQAGPVGGQEQGNLLGSLPLLLPLGCVGGEEEKG